MPITASINTASNESTQRDREKKGGENEERNLAGGRFRMKNPSADTVQIHYYK